MVWDRGAAIAPRSFVIRVLQQAYLRPDTNEYSLDLKAAEKAGRVRASQCRDQAAPLTGQGPV